MRFQDIENTRKEIFQRLRGKSFWIWDKKQHEQQDQQQPRMIIIPELPHNPVHRHQATIPTAIAIGYVRLAKSIL